MTQQEAPDQPAEPEVPLSGGRLTAGVVRVGDTVRRPTGPHSPFAHRLLRHLEAVGFEAAPRLLGVDEHGREVLRFIDGWVPPNLDHFVDEVVCHNDPPPCNYVFVDDRPAAFIDFDHAAPGDRLRDVAYAGWLWTISADDGPALSEQARRLRLMADAYGLPDTSVLLDAVLLRQEENLAAALARSQSPDPAVADYGRASATWQSEQMAWLRAHADVFPRGAGYGRQPPGRLSRVFAVVITGPPGAGKTSVLTALVDALSDDDIAHAAIEVEMMVWTHPALTDEQWARHLRVACELYREAGHRRLLVAQTLETDADVADLVDAVGADEVHLVRLEAEPASLVERIIEREPASWSGLSGLVEHAQELAATMPGLERVDLVLSTEGQRAEDVASRIRAARPDWLS